MAGAVEHDYHLIDPSPWPLVSSAAALVWCSHRREPRFAASWPFTAPCVVVGADAYSFPPVATGVGRLADCFCSAVVHASSCSIVPVFMTRPLTQ